MTFEGKTGISTHDIDPDETDLEWKIFRRVIFRNRQDPGSSDSTTTGLQDVTSSLLTDTTLNAAFPNLAHLA